ncbi:hypothetical protein C2G38_2255683 [Gigaspora rosea]|uniref:Uncharacterized protein n=1 Tax=Gigaspora rosea TaxID=44941 RepID=A0A397U4E6_9GLOM|nr:hypothetical protein C2G38_2255683 [Gigaspora rosea]
MELQQRRVIKANIINFIQTINGVQLFIDTDNVTTVAPTRLVPELSSRLQEAIKEYYSTYTAINTNYDEASDDEFSTKLSIIDLEILWKK